MLSASELLASIEEDEETVDYFKPAVLV